MAFQLLLLLLLTFETDLRYHSNNIDWRVFFFQIFTRHFPQFIIYFEFSLAFVDGIRHLYILHVIVASIRFSFIAETNQMSRRESLSVSLMTFLKCGFFHSFFWSFTEFMTQFSCSEKIQINCHISDDWFMFNHTIFIETECLFLRNLQWSITMIPR